MTEDDTARFQNSIPLGPSGARLDGLNVLNWVSEK